jgi:hypothetical protein
MNVTVVVAVKVLGYRTMLETICDIMVDAYKRNWITSRDGNAENATSTDG